MVGQLLAGTPSPGHPECYGMFGPVIAAEVCLGHAGLCQQTDNTAELTGIIEAVQFVIPLGSLLRDARVCIFLDSRFTRGIGLGSAQARTSVRL